MVTSNRRIGIVLILVMGLAGTLLGVALLAPPAQAGSSDLPPRTSMPPPTSDLPLRPPTPTSEPPTPAPQPTVQPAPRPRPEGEPDGAVIELRVQFGQPWSPDHWQELWTGVQWQDIGGRWHGVEGWQGGLDRVLDGEGWKVWWVDQKDFGTGPFRWALRHSYGGKLLAESGPFYLPRAAGETVQVEVPLAP